MEVRIQISDAVYAQLLNGTSRMRGSISLVNPNEGNFNAYRKPAPRPQGKFLRLPHGKISMNENNIRMHLLIDHAESVIPAKAIIDESRLASSFVNLMEEFND